MTSHLSAIVYGVAGIAMAFMAQNLGGTVLQASLSFTGAAGGPLLGLFFLGACFPCANWLVLHTIAHSRLEYFQYVVDFRAQWSAVWLV